MDKDKIEMKALMESAAVAEYLTQLAKGFRTGCLTVEKDGESLSLEPSGTAEVEVEARVKKDKARFSLEVTWRLAQTQEGAEGFSISGEAAKAPSVHEAKKFEDKKADAKQPEDKKTAQAAPVLPLAKPVAVAQKADVKPAVSTIAAPGTKAPTADPAKPKG